MTFARTVALLAATTVSASGLVAVAGAPASAAPQYRTELRWSGALTQACRFKLGGGWQVNVRMRNAGNRAAVAGLNRVGPNGGDGGAWTYTRTIRPGGTSGAVHLQFRPRARVMLIIGSSVGITKTKKVGVRSLRIC